MSPTKRGRKIQSEIGKNLRLDNERARLGASGFASAIAAALHKDFGGTRGAIKTVVRLTAANERAVKNWFDGNNGPSGRFLIALCRHSDRVLETVLILAGRLELVQAKKLVDAKEKLREMLAIIAEIEKPQPRMGKLLSAEE